MEDAARNKKIDEFLKEVKERIIFLTSTVKTGKYIISIETNVSQGAIGDTYILTESREKYNGTSSK
jgi:hypothetical protein